MVEVVVVAVVVLAIEIPRLAACAVDGLEVRRHPQRLWGERPGCLWRALAGAYIVVLVLVFVSVLKLERQ